VTTSSQSSSVNYANGSVTSRQQYLNANTGSNRSTHGNAMSSTQAHVSGSDKKEKPIASNSKIPTVQPEDKLRQLREEN
jgi:hypothetical protein